MPLISNPSTKVSVFRCLCGAPIRKRSPFWQNGQGCGSYSRCPCFMDEDQSLLLKLGLVVEPVLALDQDIGTVLFGRVAGRFLRVIPCRTKTRCRPARNTSKPIWPNASRNSSKVWLPSNVSSQRSWDKPQRCAKLKGAPRRTRPNVVQSSLLTARPRILNIQTVCLKSFDRNSSFAIA